MRRVVVGADLLCQDCQPHNGPEPRPAPIAGRMSSQDCLARRLQRLNFTMGVAVALVPLKQPPHEHLWLGQTVGEVFEEIGARILFSSPAFG